MFLITLLITLQSRHAGMPFLSVLTDRADGSNPTAPVKEKNLTIQMFVGLFQLLRYIDKYGFKEQIEYKHT